MDVITMSSIVQHGLIQRDRIFSVAVLLPDKPGELVRVASIIANEKGNVIKLEHNQFVSTNRNAAVELRITMEAFGTEHKQKILNALKEAGYEPKKVGSEAVLNDIEEKLKCPNDRVWERTRFYMKRMENQKRGSVNVFSIDLF